MLLLVVAVFSCYFLLSHFPNPLSHFLKLVVNVNVQILLLFYYFLSFHSIFHFVWWNFWNFNRKIPFDILFYILKAKIVLKLDRMNFTNFCTIACSFWMVLLNGWEVFIAWDHYQSISLEKKYYIVHSGHFWIKIWHFPSHLSSADDISCVITLMMAAFIF